MITLAIASLIMLVVFEAVTQLRRHEHDAQRKSYARGVLAALIDYQANNLGRQTNCNEDSSAADCAAAPVQAGRFITHYMAQDSDPTTGDSYKSTTTQTVSTPCHGEATPSQSTIYCWDDRVGSYVSHDIQPNVGQVLIIPTHLCGSNSDATAFGDRNIRDAPDTTNPGQNTVFSVVVMIGTESGGFYCLNS
jgi:hypothetical protein